MRHTTTIGLALAISGAVLGCTEKQPTPPPSPTPTPAAQTTPQVTPKGDPQVASIEEGKPAPGFTLPASNGEEISLASFRGKSQVVLYFSVNLDASGQEIRFPDIGEHCDFTVQVVLFLPEQMGKRGILDSADGNIEQFSLQVSRVDQ